MPGEIDVYTNATRVGRAQGIDFKDGNGVTVTATKDIGNSQVDVTVTNSIATTLVAYGLKGWNYDVMLWNAANAYTSGTTRFGLVNLSEGDVVSNIYTAVAAVTGTVTTIKYGIYNSAGTRLAVSGNVTTAHDAAGVSAAVPLTSPYTVPATGGYFFAALVVASTAGSFGALASVTGKTFPGSTTNVAGSEAGQTDLDATATVSASGLLPWFGWS